MHDTLKDHLVNELNISGIFGSGSKTTARETVCVPVDQVRTVALERHIDGYMRSTPHMTLSVPTFCCDGRITMKGVCLQFVHEVNVLTDDSVVMVTINRYGVRR